jgi:nucleotide-binding universal stress UspA family protein
MYHGMRISALKMLDEKKNECQKDGIDCKTGTALGNTANKILEFAKEKEIDLIVIGTRGLGGLSKLRALGSVARKVSEHSSCPVLLIH